MPAKTLFVVTHTEAVHHVEHLVGGWYDTVLTEAGRCAAKKIAAHLKAQIGDRDVELYSSDLLRASQTAEPTAHALGVKIALMPDLREMHYGVAEGRPQEWLRARQTPPPDDNRLDHRGNIEKAETRREFATRIYRAMDAIMAQPSAVKIVITHGFVPTFIVAAWVGMPLESTGYIDLRVSPGSITHLSEDEFWRSRTVVALGSTGHLE